MAPITLLLVLVQDSIANGKKAESLSYLGSLQEQYEQAILDYKASKADEDLQELVKSGMSYGTAVMTSGALSPKDKYPRALRVFREVASYDPESEDAKSNIKMIEDIYKSLGRPVPQ